MAERLSRHVLLQSLGGGVLSCENCGIACLQILINAQQEREQSGCGSNCI